MKYEVIREIFSTCSGKSTPYLSEVDTDNLDSYLESQIEEGVSTYEKTDLGNGTIVYNVLTHNLRERYTFTEM